MADMPRFKLDCEWEESNLWMYKKTSVKKNSQIRQINDVFVKVLHVGSLNFIVDFLTLTDNNMNEGPLVELILNNDFIKVNFFY